MQQHTWVSHRCQPSGEGSNFAQGAEQYSDLIDLTIGDPDLPTSEKILEPAFEDARRGHTKYTHPMGDGELRQEICRYYQRAYGLSINLNEVFVTTAGCIGMTEALLATINPGDEVIIPDPYFMVYPDQVRLAGGVPVFLETRGDENFALNPQRLESLITPKTRAILINTPNNPTGALMSREQLEEIVEIARGVGAYILCDEVYRHLTQEDSWSESIADLYEKGISVSSMSKVFSLAGLRMGWIATHDESALCAFLSHRDYNLISCGMFDDAVASIALRHSNAMLRRNQTIVRENLAILDAWVAAHEHFYYTKPKAGTTALVYYDFDVPSYDFCKRMYRETGAFVTPGDCFEQPHSMRIGYACDKQTLTEGLAALAAFGEMLG